MRVYHNTKTFIEKSNIIHNNFFTYLDTIFVKANQKVIITCPIHGYFKQTPHDHLDGHGCKKCWIAKFSKNQSYNTEIFSSKAIEKYKLKYNYSKVNYVDSYTPVTIICAIHNEFKQRPNDHLHGKGCPKCNYSQGEKIIESFLTKNLIEYKAQLKIDGCKNKKLLPFDFGIYDNNKLVGLIEFQGEQHYICKDFFGGEAGFLKIKNNDKIKKLFCKKNNTSLLCISYKDTNNISEILYNFMEQININNKNLCNRTVK